MQAKFHKNYIIKIHLSLLVSALILLYWQSFAYWIHTWVNNFDYMFGFIMPLLSFYIIWKRRDLFEFTPVKPSKSGLLIIIVGILLYVGGQAAYINVAQQVSFFIIIPGIILHYFGFHMLRLLSIPLLILVFMVPFPDFFYSYLQSFFTWASVEILRVFNVPVYAEGYSIQLPNISVWVGPGCTGIRSMTAMLPIGLTIAHLYFDSRWNKVSMVIFSAILPILANIFRIVSLLIFALKENPIFVYGVLVYPVRLCKSSQAVQNQAALETEGNDNEPTSFKSILDPRLFILWQSYFSSIDGIDSRSGSCPASDPVRYPSCTKFQVISAGSGRMERL